MIVIAQGPRRSVDTNAGAPVSPVASLQSLIHSGLISGLAPQTSPEPPSGECLDHTGIAEYVLPLTVEVMTRMSNGVVIGTVEEVGAARWDNAKGDRPSDELEITVGAAPSPDEVLWVPGGTIGCHRFILQGIPDLKPGARYVFFLSSRQPSMARAGELAGVAIWPVDETSHVVTPEDGSVSLSDFRRRVQGSD